MYDCYSCKYLISNILNENIQFIEQLSVWVTARFRYFDESFCQMALSNTNLKREQLLPSEQTALLEKLRQSRDYNASIGLEAAFQAGLSIGLKLSRL